MSDYPKRKTILCIDDDDGVLGYQRALLERSGYSVLTATFPGKGYKLRQIGRMAALIVDYHMPEINGHEVALKVRRLRPQIPIIVVSSDDEIPEYVLKVVDAFVCKYEAPSRLLPVLTRFCGEGPSGIPERITA